MIGKLSEKDMFGRFYLKSVPSEGLYNNYYASLEAIRPLIKSKSWPNSPQADWIYFPVNSSNYTLNPEDIYPDCL